MIVHKRERLTKVRKGRRRTGAMTVLICILLPALLALAAFAINIAHIESTNTEIQIAADSAARSAGRVYAVTGSKAEAYVAAQDALFENPIGDGYILPITAADLEIGKSERQSTDGAYVFRPSGQGNAVRLTTRSLADGTVDALKPILPVFGFTREIRPLITSVSTQGDIDIALVIDRSGSMAYAAREKAVYPPKPKAAPPGWKFGDSVPRNARWLDLLVAVKAFNSRLEESPQEEQLSLAVYNDRSKPLVRLSKDYQPVIRELDKISRSFEIGGTNIGQGMLEGMKLLADKERGREHTSKVIVLMTDGVHNFGKHPISAAKTIAAEGVTVFTITFSKEAKKGQMRRVADLCGGKHFHANNASDLTNAFEEIAKHLPNLITE